MRWNKRGWISPKMVSEDGIWEIFDAEYGHAGLRYLKSNRHYLLTSSGATSANAIKEAEERIKEFYGR